MASRKQTIEQAWWLVAVLFNAQLAMACVPMATKGMTMVPVTTPAPTTAMTTTTTPTTTTTACTCTLAGIPNEGNPANVAPLVPSPLACGASGAINAANCQLGGLLQLFNSVVAGGTLCTIGIAATCLSCSSPSPPNAPCTVTCTNGQLTFVTAAGGTQPLVSYIC